jgi:hypothetical protein
MHSRIAASRVVTSLTLCLTLSWMAGGCNRGPRLVSVQGTVKVNGKPLNQGVVMFYPATGRPATGQIAENGTYSLTTYAPNDGAAPGEYAVTIDAVEVDSSAPPPTSLEAEIAAGASGTPPVRSTVRYLVPEKYADRTTTPLKATVQEDGNVIDFDIQ